MKTYNQVMILLISSVVLFTVIFVAIYTVLRAKQRDEAEMGEDIFLRCNKLMQCHKVDREEVK